jgi:hypothetical protein
MGKLGGLLSSGIGLAMEATAKNGKSSSAPRVYDASRYERMFMTKFITTTVSLRIEYTDTIRICCSAKHYKRLPAS